jgi:hypothetical protein
MRILFLCGAWSGYPHRTQRSVASSSALIERLLFASSYEEGWGSAARQPACSCGCAGSAHPPHRCAVQGREAHRSSCGQTWQSASHWQTSTPRRCKLDPGRGSLGVCCHACTNQWCKSEKFSQQWLQPGSRALKSKQTSTRPCAAPDGRSGSGACRINTRNDRSCSRLQIVLRPQAVRSPSGVGQLNQKCCMQRE